MPEDVIYRQIHRPDAALVARAAECAMSDLYEALPPAVHDRVNVCESRISMIDSANIEIMR